MAWIPLGEGGYRLGKYRALAHIGAGGMGAVYRAVNEETGQEVALKVLPPEVASRPTAVDRFLCEARHGALLHHPHIVAIHELGRDQDTYFLALELVDGIDLAKHIQRHGPLDADLTRQVLVQMTLALDHAHRLNLVHRDVKPSNILLSRPEGRVVAKLTDLGLSRVIDDESFRVTQDGTTVGTVDYLAPEQARNSGAADIRSDIYSLGCTLFHMLTGKPPFAQGSLTERLFAHAEGERPDPRRSNPEIPDDLCRVCLRMMAPKPEDRFQTPGELLRDLLSERVTASAASAVERPDPEAAARPARRKKRRRLHLPHASAGASGRAGFKGAEAPTPPPLPEEDPSPATPEQRRVAAGQYERAAEVLADDNFEYGLPLLLTCCQLDPTNLTYRAALREGQRRKLQTASSGWLAWAKTLGTRMALKRARKAADHWKVLQHGEELLMLAPDEIPIHLEMAEAAEASRCCRLALWLLEQARAIEPTSVPVMRALALLHESFGDFPKATSLWEEVQQADPNHGEARRKLRDLAARITIARGRYRQHLTGWKDPRRWGSQPDRPASG